MHFLFASFLCTSPSLPKLHSLQVKRLHLHRSKNSQGHTPEHVVMCPIWVTESYGAVLAQLELLHVQLAADVTTIRLLPCDKRIEQFPVRHSLLQKIGHFALPW